MSTIFEKDTLAFVDVFLFVRSIENAGTAETIRFNFLSGKTVAEKPQTKMLQEVPEKIILKDQLLLEGHLPRQFYTGKIKEYLQESEQKAWADYHYYLTMYRVAFENQQQLQFYRYVFIPKYVESAAIPGIIELMYPKIKSILAIEKSPLTQ